MNSANEDAEKIDCLWKTVGGAATEREQDTSERKQSPRQTAEQPLRSDGSARVAFQQFRVRLCNLRSESSEE